MDGWMGVGSWHCQYHEEEVVVGEVAEDASW